MKGQHTEDRRIATEHSHEQSWTLGGAAEMGAVRAFLAFAARAALGRPLAERKAWGPEPEGACGWAASFDAGREPGAFWSLEANGRLLRATWRKSDEKDWEALALWCARAFAGRGSWAPDPEGPQGLIEGGWSEIKREAEHFWYFEATETGEKCLSRARALAMVSAALDSPMPAECLAVAIGRGRPGDRAKAFWAVDHAAQMAHALNAPRAAQMFMRAGAKSEPRGIQEAASFLGVSA